MGRLVSMRRALEVPELATRAHDQAAAAAERAEVEVSVLDSIDGFRDASAIFDSVWGTGPANAQMPAELIRALTHAGGYAAGALSDRSMLGAVVGFLGRDEGGLHLHSHILGVRTNDRARGVGYALKLHQRAWALERGLQRVAWTFDPLVRRNAFFNFQKLGASAKTYFVNFYGSMTDGVNVGDESDRLLIEWDLDSTRVSIAADGGLDEPSVDELIDDGAVALSVTDDGRPRLENASASTLLCATPESIVALRRERADVALEWRRALRETLGGAMRDAYSVRGFTRSGWYVIERDEGPGE